MVSVSVKVESVAVSVVDSEPAEVCYICLEDIEVSVERTRALISTAATVQLVQISNQLLDPVFQVMLFPRQRKQNNIQNDGSDGTGGSSGGGGSSGSPALTRAGAGSAQAHAAASRLVSSLSAPRGAAREENVGLLSSSRATASASATQIPFKGLSR